MKKPYLRLGVNIDHVATLRNARGGWHPDPVRAAHLAILGGRRRHHGAPARGPAPYPRRGHPAAEARDPRPPQFRDGATDEMIAIASRVRPHAACLVPEKREERTTEGGLDIVAALRPPRPRRAGNLSAKASACRSSSSRRSISWKRRARSERRSWSSTPAAYCDACAYGEEARIAHELGAAARAPRRTAPGSGSRSTPATA